MNNRPIILLTNDDGIHTPGIEHLWRALHQADVADLFIIAPQTERSGAGLSVTSDRPMLIQKIEWPETPAWSVDGTPADCVKMGIRVILNKKPNFILSGINAGSNAGQNVLYSGTVGAVIEGVLRGIPGVAFSCVSAKSPNYHLAQKYVVHFFHYLMQHPLPPGCFLNVNFPENVTDNVKGFRFTRQGKGRWSEDPYLHSETEYGQSYWLGTKMEEPHESEDSDVALLKQGYVTAVPIHIEELTFKESLNKGKLDFDKFFSTC